MLTERVHHHGIDKTCSLRSLTRTRDCLPRQRDDDEEMDVRLLSAAMLSGIALIALGPARAATATPALTQAQVVKRFETATGRKPVAWPGHPGALRLPKSATNLAFYGDFVLWVVAPDAREANIQRLLSSGQTGELGTPGAAGIYWEQGSYLGGEPYWLGKKLYGANVVLWRYGTAAKVDRSFSRLHKVLLKVVAAP